MTGVSYSFCDAYGSRKSWVEEISTAAMHRTGRTQNSQLRRYCWYDLDFVWESLMMHEATHGCSTTSAALGGTLLHHAFCLACTTSS